MCHGEYQVQKGPLLESYEDIHMSDVLRQKTILDHMPLSLYISTTDTHTFFERYAATCSSIPATCFNAQTVASYTEARKCNAVGLWCQMFFSVYIMYRQTWVELFIYGTH